MGSIGPSPVVDVIAKLAVLGVIDIGLGVPTLCKTLSFFEDSSSRM